MKSLCFKVALFVVFPVFGLSAAPQAVATPESRSSIAEESPFTEPARGRLAQLVLSIAEGLAASLLYPSKPAASPAPAKKDLKALSEQLVELFERPLDETHRLNLLDALTRAYKQRGGSAAQLPADVMARLERLETSALISDPDRLARVTQLLETEVSQGVGSLAPAHKGLSKLRYLKRIGAALLIADILARLYVWQALKADPTLSPLATYLLQ